MEENTGKQSEHGETFVLIVDDEFSIRDLLGKFLSTKGISCLMAATVEEAISLLRTRKPGLVLLDWGLRGQMDSDGALVLRFCRVNFPSLPVIVMSGQVFDESTIALVDEADGFWQKPFDLVSITDHVLQCLNRKPVQAGD